MFEVQAETEIAAPVGFVWAVLTDMHAYAAWSTMLQYLGGDLIEGGIIRLRLSLPNGPSYTFTFELTALADGRTRLRNREIYSGLLAPLFQRLPMMRDAPSGFAAMNREIQTRAEAIAPQLAAHNLKRGHA